MTSSAFPDQREDAEVFKTALSAYRQAEVRTAYERCIGILEKSPGFHPAAHLAGVIAFERGHHDVAQDLLRNAVAAAPGKAAYYCDLALPLRALDEYEAALLALDKALAIEPGLRPALNIKASLLTHLGRGQAAVETLEALAGLQPGDASVYLRLGLARRNLGELDAARACLEKAITLQPDSTAAYWILSSLSAASEAVNHIEPMQALLGAATAPQAQIELCFALAREHEDLGQYARAFEYLAQGNALRRQQVGYDPASERAVFREIEEIFSDSFMARQSRGDQAGPGPIFIVGMPRTGSTLLERILAGHSQVSSAGELQVLEGLLLQESQRTSQKFPALVQSLGDADFRRLGQAYLEKSQPFRDGAPVFIDKMPMNFLYAGMIRAMLPAARVISMRRDPIDTCFSCYKQLFGAQYRFSYDLRELGGYYKLYEALMGHWHAVMPDQILEVRYEDLVSETETQARRVLAFCGLEWEAGCMDFQRSPDSVRTPSAVQVREAPHRRSIGRWREYRAQLAPLLEVLGKT